MPSVLTCGLNCVSIKHDKCRCQDTDKAPLGGDENAAAFQHQASACTCVHTQAHPPTDTYTHTGTSKQEHAGAQGCMLTYIYKYTQAQAHTRFRLMCMHGCGACVQASTHLTSRTMKTTCLTPNVHLSAPPGAHPSATSECWKECPDREPQGVVLLTLLDPTLPVLRGPHARWIA